MCAAHYMGWEVSLDGCAVAGILEAGMGCSSVGVLGSPGCRGGLAVRDNVVLGLGMEWE